MRLTRHAADDVEPSFSADGSRIAFQSSRLGGGIYVIPTLGGEERLLAAATAFRRGFHRTETGSPMASRSGAVAESMSRPPRAVPRRPSLRTSIGHRRMSGHPTAVICCSGHNATATRRPENNIDWYVAAIPGGTPVPLDARNVLAAGAVSRPFQGLPFPDAWVGAGNRILFHGQRRRLLEHVAGGALPPRRGASAARRSGRHPAPPTKPQRR